MEGKLNNLYACIVLKFAGLTLGGIKNKINGMIGLHYFCGSQQICTCSSRSEYAHMNSLIPRSRFHLHSISPCKIKWAYVCLH